MRITLASVTGFVDGAENVREDRANDEVDLVAVDERFDFGDGDVGLELVVGDEDFGLAAAELAAQILDRELKPLRSCWPSTAGGPDRVAMMPTLRLSCGVSGGPPCSERGCNGNERSCI